MKEVVLGSYDIIHAHKLGGIHVTALQVNEEMLWIGTRAGMSIHLRISQLVHALSTNKLSSNSNQFECLSFGRAGPVRFFLSNTEKGKRFFVSIGDGFEDFNQNDEHFGKDDALSLILSLGNDHLFLPPNFFIFQPAGHLLFVF